jgi:hypothetical protein
VSGAFGTSAPFEKFFVPVFGSMEIVRLPHTTQCVRTASDQQWHEYDTSEVSSEHLCDASFVPPFRSAHRRLRHSDRTNMHQLLRAVQLHPNGGFGALDAHLTNDAARASFLSGN